MSGISTRWFLGIANWCAIVSAFATSANCALAQITPDSTLPNNSSVNLNGSTFNITGGTSAGSNLFHSFQQFSVPNGNAAIFQNPVNILNIISRVTGGSISEINGQIGTSELGRANLFLINPNGIVFGQNARLNVGGSFVATTANAIGFGNQGIFSASNPNNPALLTINPSALVFNQIAKSIENKSRAPIENNPAGFEAFGLRVPNGKSLLLVGGDIKMDGGQLNAYGGRVELGGLANPGTVTLLNDGNNLSSSFPIDVARANVSLDNGARVSVQAAGGGSIAVNAQDLEVLGGSILSAGIGQDLGSVDTVGGDITLNATGEIKVVGQNSRIYNYVRPRGQGKGGNLIIKTRELLVQNGGEVSTITRGPGKGGNLTVTAESVKVSNGDLLAQTRENATGAAGDLTINTGNTGTLRVQDGGRISASTYGAGQGGNLTVTAGSVEVSNGNLFAQANENTTGAAGDLTINTGTLLVKDGAQVSASTSGSGKGGNLTVTARSVEVSNRGDLLAQTRENATGAAGNLTIETGSLRVQDGGRISASTYGAGQAGNLTVTAESVEVSNGNLFAQANQDATGAAGNLTIETGTLLVKDGAEVSTSTDGSGEGGNLTVTARSVEVSNRGNLFAEARKNATGAAGDLTINTGTLLVKDRGEVSASTSGAGQGGNLTVNASDSVEVSNRGFLLAETIGNAIGAAGNLTIETGTLRVQDGGEVSTSTFGAGQGGNLTVNASDSVEVTGTTANGQSGSSLAAETRGTGNAGLLSIDTGRLIVRDGGTVTVRNEGKGGTSQAGNLQITARSINLDQGSLTANTNSGSNGGDIILNASDLLLLRNNSTISASAGTTDAGGNGGNITINAPSGFIVAAPNENSDITANAFSGSGGRVTINATGIYEIAPLSRQDLERRLPPGAVLNPRQLPTNDITAISQQNPSLSGQVNLNTPNVDPSQGLVQLPTVLVDTPRLVASGCAAFDSGNSSFTITGRGGLPPSPEELLTNDVVWSDNRILQTMTQQRSSEKPVAEPILKPKPEPVAIVPATGWVFNGKGQVTLISSAPKATGLGSNPANCPTQ
ncbi:MAG: filamentous hemagglutinin N-terminal domain-containing protein [Cyanomargarita calcarea GSE-NOS-MK-12-04C]|jgi:filamentous hemagglutinin family protein|uniref:Filamentous hemagglutinin N-terminal domain-containing protein n=1 Tax=Cyanomargarita calcarea GSE-NOS-MK-12-04C TaxID=2839659 RepID=A0A951UQZ0_9CYAN|nr:filamentous hemagglutinin N-terminal domain-containing protein [Cyanomargarita calcarea GSE-NOS-MK-12-04C]